MKRRISLIIITILILSLISFAPGRVARATTYDYDFTINDQGFAATGDGDTSGCDNPGRLAQAFYNSGVGWESSTTSGTALLCIWRDLGAVVSITSIEVIWDAGNASSGGTRFIGTSAGGTGTFSTGLDGTAGAHDQTFSGLSIVGDHVIVVADSNGHPEINTIYEIIITGTTLTPTPGPTFTGTPVPNPPDQGGTLPGACLLLGDHNATFFHMPGQWDVFGDVANPPGQSDGALVSMGAGNGGNVSQTVYLDPHGSYKMVFKYHTGFVQSGQYFRAFLGDSPPFLIPIVATTDPQDYETPFSSFSPDEHNSNAYTFKLTFSVENPLTDDPALVWDYACIVSNQVDTTGRVNPITTSCERCTYAPIGGVLGLPEDIVKLFNWLMCGLRQLVVCFLASFLNGIWGGIVQVISFLAFVRLWLGLAFNNAFVWFGRTLLTLWAWLGGAYATIILLPFNAVVRLFNALGIGNVVNSVLAWIGGALVSVFNFLAHLIPLIIGIAGGLIAIIVYWVGLFIKLLGQILTAIPVFFSSLINGINSPPTDVPIYAPTCTDQTNILFWPCLGSYVLDLTIFEGPIYLAMLVALGALAFDVIMWATKTIQEALST